MISDADLILVTGASGFLASHIVKQLLEQGYRVRGTVRSLKDEKKCKPLRNLAQSAKHELELVEADLLSEEQWLSAVRECTYVIHVASPVPNYVPKDENEVIKPAVNGTLFVLKAAAQPESKVKRVVLTSSIAAIAGDAFETDRMYTEKDWPDLNSLKPYSKSKVLAEKAAWDFVQERKKSSFPCFELAVINPGYICGPILHDTFCASMELVSRMMNGQMPFIPDISLPSCDVRDVAKAHLVALTLPEAHMNRHIIVTDSHTLQDFAFWLKEEFQSKGFSISTRMAPSFLIKLYGFFDKTIAYAVPLLGKRPKFDNTRFRNVLGFQSPLETKQSIIQMAVTMMERGYFASKR